MAKLKWMYLVEVELAAEFDAKTLPFAGGNLLHAEGVKERE